jgi:flagellar assembly protein FliH
MALIKNDKSQRFLKEAIVLDMGDLARQAEQILESARADAAQILDRAKAQANAMIDAADERGYSAGFERGRVEGLDAGQREGEQTALLQRTTQIDQLVERWSAALKSWDDRRSIMIQEAHDDILRFAIEVARKVVQRTVQADPSIVRDQLSAALALLGRPTAVKVTVHPEDRLLVEQILPGLLEKLSSAAHASIAVDDLIMRGGCIVAADGGRVDATIDTQLQRIAEALVPQGSSPPQMDADASQIT